MPKLENWCVIGTPLTISLKGTVFGHKSVPDGWILETEPIITIDGRIIKTNTGNEYILGKIEICFKAFLLSMFEEKLDEDFPLLFLGELFEYKEQNPKRKEPKIY